MSADHRNKIDVIIPALNEADSIAQVLCALPGGWVRRTIVADNGSTDRTVEVARSHGATVVSETRRGYGSACLKGIDALRGDPPDIVVFLDADFSDDPRELPELVMPLLDRRADLCVGSRTRGKRERGALTLPQHVGNLIACTALQLLYGAKYTDLGPFRAIRFDALESLAMEDPDFGWTVEMQIKAAQKGLRHAEIPVSYRKRHAGVSKVSGSMVGSFHAGRIILTTLARSYSPSKKRHAPSSN